MLQSELDNIKGIGEKTKTLLLKEFKSLEELKYLPVDKLQNLIGKHKATIVKEKLK
jgi:excinuclease ABC subunit C